MRVVITGGAGDLGLPLARRVVARGSTVILLDRRSEPPAEAAKFISEHADLARYVSADVTDPARLNAALKRQPPVTVLVHGAGALADGPVEQVDGQKGELARTVKWLGWINIVRACRGRLRQGGCRRLARGVF